MNNLIRITEWLNWFDWMIDWIDDEYEWSGSHSKSVMLINKNNSDTSFGWKLIPLLHDITIRIWITFKLDIVQF